MILSVPSKRAALWVFNRSVGSANEGEVGDMSKDLWGRLADPYDVDRPYIASADLVGAIQSELAAALPGGIVEPTSTWCEPCDRRSMDNDRSITR